MSLEQRLQYSPSNCFLTYPFPKTLWQVEDPQLAEIGERYHMERKVLMQSLGLGLTKLYNLFHSPRLSPQMVAEVSKKDAESAALAWDGLLVLRRSHVELDTEVRNAYGWLDLDLQHDFHEVETLPENDRVRYTMSASARREVLQRLLAANQARTDGDTK